ncbi:MAG: VCBS repeat-containing protein [Bermanella sp.]
MLESLKYWPPIVALTIIMTACGSSNEKSNTPPAEDVEKIDLHLSPDLSVNNSTSYEAQKSEFRHNRLFGFEENRYSGVYHGVGYGDFDDDGDIDFLQSGSNLVDKQRPYFYRQNNNGEFVREDSFITGGEGLIHPRKTIVGDFNGDDIPDVVNFGHGLDQEPFAGEVAELYLSTKSNLEFSNALSSYTGYFHSGAAGDIDNDGDLDILMGDATNDGFYFLINNGNAQFTKSSDRITNADQVQHRGYTTELIDVNEDGYLDLLKGGHEIQGMDTAIYYGNSTGRYESPVILPTIDKLGTVLDIEAEDINGDSLKDIIILRTGDNSGGKFTLYQGFYVQLLVATGEKTFIDQSNNIERRTDWAKRGGEDFRDRGVDAEYDDSNLSGEAPLGGWIDWIRVQDINSDGLPDIIDYQDARNITWINNGDGSFSSNFKLEGEDYWAGKNDPYEIYE